VPLATEDREAAAGLDAEVWALHDAVWAAEAARERHAERFRRWGRGFGRLWFWTLGCMDATWALQHPGLVRMRCRQPCALALSVRLPTRRQGARGVRGGADAHRVRGQGRRGPRVHPR
jgi:hypothetical protein